MAIARIVFFVELYVFFGILWIFRLFFFVYCFKLLRLFYKLYISSFCLLILIFVALSFSFKVLFCLYVFDNDFCKFCISRFFDFKDVLSFFNLFLSWLFLCKIFVMVFWMLFRIFFIFSRFVLFDFLIVVLVFDCKDVIIWSFVDLISFVGGFTVFGELFLRFFYFLVFVVLFFVILFGILSYGSGKELEVVLEFLN